MAAMSAAADRVVASLGDALVRESDVQLLEGPHWLNDNLIGFFFEYLHKHRFESTDRIRFMSPEVTQFFKLARGEDLMDCLQPLQLEQAELILLAVNDAEDPSIPGGSHWSLLVYSRQALAFYHLDSGGGVNRDDAQRLARKLHWFLDSRRRHTAPARPLSVPSLPSRPSPSCSASEFRFEDVEVPAQGNGYDCGVHVLCHAENATRHLLVYGSPKGMEPLDLKRVKEMRADVKGLIVAHQSAVTAASTERSKSAE